MSRALVLGGGGPVGIAWESGVVAGLARRGVDVSAADRIVGTSAGSVVGARLALGQQPDLPAAPAGSTDAAGLDASMAPRLAGLMEAFMAAAAAGGTPQEVRARLGRFALEQETVPEETFLAWFSELAGAEWPPTYACTAVHARTGEFVVWDASSDVGLQGAVASSCSVPGIFPPITIGGDRYIDGGMRSPLNADVVAGAEIVLAVSVMPTSAAGAVMPGELDAVRAAGSRLEVVEADRPFVELSGNGMHLMDSGRMPRAYELGLALGDQVADRVGTAWNG